MVTRPPAVRLTGVRRALTATGVAVAVAATLTACGGKGREPDRGGTGRATGPPVVVGLVNQEGAPLGSFPELRRGAEAAVAHVNEDLAGIGGRPIRLEVCTTRGTPESSQACALELTAKKPVAVLGGVDLGASASLPVFAKAGIPYVGGSPTLGEELMSSNAFMLAGGTVADLLGEAQFALDTLGAKRIGALYVDVPGSLSTVIAAAQIVLRSKGATDVKVVAEKAEAADFVPALKSVSQGNPDAIFVVFPAQSCARIMAARQALDLKAEMFYPGACASKAVVDAAGKGAEGAWFASGYLPFGDPSPEVATWRTRTDDESSLSQAGFATVMNLRQLLVEAGADHLTPADLVRRLKETKAHPAFMGHPYTCDGKQLPFLRSVCNPFVRILHLQSGEFRDVEGNWVSGAKLVEGFG
ncbi:MAG: ABC transporter substrate-binding protein [Acidimicrobiales bacterium]